ncbi:MAG: hypothetical protein M3N49_00425 [Candidatus Eremiobacteraeota bacterium]|nr:hypothetical protein [Candidatus Eremiobacteraeota bacterium]
MILDKMIETVQEGCFKMPKFGFDNVDTEDSTSGQIYKLALLGCPTTITRAMKKGEAWAKIAALEKELREAEPFASATQRQLVRWLEGHYPGIITGRLEELNARGAGAIIRTWLPKADPVFALMVSTNTV